MFPPPGRRADSGLGRTSRVRNWRHVMNAAVDGRDASAKPQAADAKRQAVDAKPQAAGREAQGRIVKGNGGGSGKPFGRKVAQLRAAVVNFVTEEDLKHIVFKLMMMAESGNLQAMKLLFQYVIGKPAAAVDPDRLDVDEWRAMQEQSRPVQEMAQVMNGLPAE